MANRRRYTRPSKRIKRNLGALWALTTPEDRADGSLWYRRAHGIASELSSAHGITLAQAAGVIAAISPGSRWERNVDDARALVAAFVAGDPLPIAGTYGRRNVEKARAILEGSDPLEILGGPKVRAFYGNILRPDVAGPVTVDRHARGAAYWLRGDSAAELRSEAEYRYIARHFEQGARAVGMLPHEYQATLWVAWRRIGAAPAATVEVPF